MTEVSFPEGNLIFDEKGGSAVLERCGGIFTEVVIPDKVADGIPVKSILKKAFLGKKTIRSVIVPETVAAIGDFCFAHCSNLAKISLPKCEMGEGVFKGCDKLEIISVAGCDEDMGVLLAAAIRYGAPAHLTDMKDLGTGYYEKWDAWLEKLLSEPDDEGFTNQILCGEEDYGNSDRNLYEIKRRMLKSSLCMIRLLNASFLAKEQKIRLSEYIYDHREGGDKGNESWLALKEYYPDKRHFDLFNELGCITNENRDAMIVSLGEDKAELKSLLIKTSGESAMDDFFDSLEL